MKRRKFLTKTTKGLGLFSLAAIGGLAYLKPKELSKAFSPKFKNLNEALKGYKRAIPSLLLDLDVVDSNIEALKNNMNADVAFRIVVKSLPSKELLEYTMKKANTKKLMVFHQPFLSELSRYSDQSIDVLFGKPMPIQNVKYYYQNLVTELDFNPAKQVQWLIDTKERAIEYIKYAKESGNKLLLNLELDVGLHRGGFANTDTLKEVLTLIRANKDFVSFSGFMGYDAYLVKVPSLLLPREKGFSKVVTFYNECKATVKNDFPELWHSNLTFNGAGSPTIALHNTKESPINDLSAGSFLVKPTDFDIDTLEDFNPACYIVSPILKKYKNTSLPSIEKMSGLLNAWDSNSENSFYIYGGSWSAIPYEPKGFKPNPIFGKSTNQVMINASDDSNLNVSDWVFFRPTQSEAVFLEFENIIPFRGNTLLPEWTLLNS